MKKIVFMTAGILLLVCFAFGIYVEERDYGTKSTEKVVRLPANTVTTLNLVADSYFTLIQNFMAATPWIGTSRTVTPDSVGFPLYPSGNMTWKGNFELFAVSNRVTSLNVGQHYE